MYQHRRTIEGILHKIGGVGRRIMVNYGVKTVDL
jgi:hypothetical protein